MVFKNDFFCFGIVIKIRNEKRSYKLIRFARALIFILIHKEIIHLNLYFQVHSFLVPLHLLLHLQHRELRL